MQNFQIQLLAYNIGNSHKPNFIKKVDQVWIDIFGEQKSFCKFKDKSQISEIIM